MLHVLTQKNSLVNNVRRIINILNVKREKRWFIAHVYFMERRNEDGDENASKLLTNLEESIAYGKSLIYFTSRHRSLSINGS
jgi:hypothetical protein